MSSPAFWIHPEGYIVSVIETHIKTIIWYPKKFGYPTDKINSQYKKYKEKVGIEGKAREQIIIELAMNGWIRLRRQNQYWSISLGKLNDRNKTYLRQWCKKITEKGLGGCKETDKQMPLEIYIAATQRTNEKYTLEDCIQGKLKASKTVKTRLKFRKSPEELPDRE